MASYIFMLDIIASYLYFVNIKIKIIDIRLYFLTGAG